MFGPTMTTATDEEPSIRVEVAMPSSLLEDIDRYARLHGHPTRSAVVAEALEE